MTTAQILEEVAVERAWQDKKWGVQRHKMAKWLVILGEEMGEACKALLEMQQGRIQSLRAELIQCAAVAVAAIESLDDGSEDYSDE